MLQTIREHTQGWIASIIISVIILSFALWGIHSYFVGGGRNTVVATVNGIDINERHLASAYERLRRQVQAQYGANAITSNNEPLLKQQALQALIDIEALSQAAKHQGFYISEQQIENYLQALPEFQENGQFSIQRLRRILATLQLSDAEFLKLIKTSLLIDQPKVGITYTAFALPNETDIAVKLINQERNLAYLTIPTNHFNAKQLVVPQKDIVAYYDSHKNEFLTPEQVSVDYIELNVADIAKTIKPSEADLKQYFEDNINTYANQQYEAVKKQVRANYIQQKAEEKFADMKEQLADLTFENPTTFMPAAKTLNLTIKKSEFFNKDKPGAGIAQYKKIRNTAFSNEVLVSNNNSDVIDINDSTAVVLRINTHVKSAYIPLNAAAETIEIKLQKQMAERESKQLAALILNKLQQSETNPESLAKQYHLTWREAGFIGRYATKVDNTILDAAFHLPNIGMNSHKAYYAIANLSDGVAVIMLKAVREGKMNDAKHASVFAEQAQNNDGLLEYELYKQSQINQARVKIYTVQ